MSIDPTRYVEVSANGSPTDPQAAADLAAAAQAGAIAGDIAGRAAGAEAGAAAGTEVAASAGAAAGATAGEIAGTAAGTASGATAGAAAGASAGSTSGATAGAAAATALMAARSITGGGLATGGGTLAADRVITVTEASQAEAEAGTSGTVAMTPRRVVDAFNFRTTAYTRSLLTTANQAAFLAALGAIPTSASTYTAAGTGAVAQTLQAWIRARAINARDYGVDSGAADNTAAWNLAVAAAAGRALYLPGSGNTYKFLSQPNSPPASTSVFGDGERQTILEKLFSGDFVTMNDGVSFSGFSIKGNGATRTGRLVILSGGNQVMRDFKPYDGDATVGNTGACIYIPVGQGGRLQAENVEASRNSSIPGSNRYAVCFEDTLQGGNPTTWINFKSGGAESFDFGGCNNCLVSGSAIFDFKTTVNTRDLQINGRIAATNPIDLYGSGVISADFGSNVTLKAGSVYQISGIYNGTWTDETTNGDNLVFSAKAKSWSTADGAVVSCGGVPITLGTGGSVTGSYVRTGRSIRLIVRLIPGTGPTFPAGIFSINLPTATAFTLPQTMYAGSFETTGGVIYGILGKIAASGGASVSLYGLNGTGACTSSSPGTMGAGGAIYLDITYLV